jgi:hypothetical protein
LLGNLGAFRMRIPQGTPKLVAPAAIEFAADSLRDEPAAILLPAVDLLQNIVRQSHSHAFDGSHFILLV